MKNLSRKVLIIFFGLILGLFLIPNFTLAEDDNFICAVYFTGVGCTHCAKTDSVILEQLPKEYPNLVVIEYEIYQQRESAPLLYLYDEVYNSGLGIPLIIFGREDYIGGDRPILNNVRNALNKVSNPCPLISDNPLDFGQLNLASLLGFPKIWHQERILMRLGPKAESQILKNLLIKDNLNEVLKDVDFEEIEPFNVPLSGKYVKFDNALKIADWIFQWNGEGLDYNLFPVSSAEESPSEFLPEDLQLPDKTAEIESKLTLAKILSLAAVDAVNPCALAVLTLMLIAILTYNPQKRRNILLAGLAFVISVFVMYLIYGLIIIKSFQLIQSLTFIRLWLYKILGLGAIIFGCFKLKAFFQAKAVCKVSPKVDKVISKITSPGGAFLVGAFVTIFLLPCTIGPYIICGGILCPLGILKALPLLLLYNLIFVLPMVAMVLIIYLGLSKIEDISSWQAKHIKYLDLISGLIIIGLGLAMIFGLV